MFDETGNWLVKRVGHGTAGSEDTRINSELTKSNSKRRLSVTIQYKTKPEIWRFIVPKTCKGKCGRKISYQNKTGYCKECFGRFILSPKGANASRRDASKQK